MGGLQGRLFGLATVMLALATSTVAHAQFSVLYNFGSMSSDPYNPTYSGIIAQGRDGNLYTSATLGGTAEEGAVFKITPSGAVTLLYSFSGPDGAAPLSGLTLGTDGNFYGTTYTGGSYCCGTIFKVTPSGALKTIYNYPGNSDGNSPYAPPVQGTDGNWYGTMSSGGANGEGTVYKLTPAGVLTTLYSFDGTHGAEPRAPLVQGTDGNLYGTTVYGGTIGDGVVFKITTVGKLKVLYNFDDTHGRFPVSPVVQGTDGNFYGTTLDGGSTESGVVFKLTPAGKLTVLHTMNGTTEGSTPAAGLVQGTDGNFYGANSQVGKASSGCPSGCGTTFKITPAGKLTVLHNYDLTTGSTPYDTPFQNTNGIVYGDTYSGGTGNVSPCSAGVCGVFYSWNTSLPSFVSLLPTSGKVGKIIGILGQGFSSSSIVKFDGVQATSVKNTGTTFLSATVPTSALTGSVTVTTGSSTLTSNKTFRVTPQILSFSPPNGPVGTTVTIKGVSLTQTTKVTFGGVKATTFTVNSDIQVTATVPTGAITGHIAITTPGGIAVSSGIFTVTQ